MIGLRCGWCRPGCEYGGGSPVNPRSQSASASADEPAQSMCECRRRYVSRCGVRTFRVVYTTHPVRRTSLRLARRIRPIGWQLLDLSTTPVPHFAAGTIVRGGKASKEARKHRQPSPWLCCSRPPSIPLPVGGLAWQDGPRLRASRKSSRRARKGTLGKSRVFVCVGETMWTCLPLMLPPYRAGSFKILTLSGPTDNRLHTLASNRSFAAQIGNVDPTALHTSCH